jgi:hypothetical protein
VAGPPEIGNADDDTDRVDGPDVGEAAGEFGAPTGGPLYEPMGGAYEPAAVVGGGGPTVGATGGVTRCGGIGGDTGGPAAGGTGGPDADRPADGDINCSIGGGDTGRAAGAHGDADTGAAESNGAPTAASEGDGKSGPRLQIGWSSGSLTDRPPSRHHRYPPMPHTRPRIAPALEA